MKVNKSWDEIKELLVSNKILSSTQRDR
jgi:hypothetical protein